ncbi:MAG: insulinase family protein [Gemmatimonadales bacterium]
MRRLLPLLATYVAACSSGGSMQQLATAPYPTDPPAPTELRPLEFPEFAEATLANGLRIVVVENHELPIVSMSLSMPAGDSHDPAGLEGLATMTATLLDQGTETRSALEIAEAIETVGGSLGASSGPDFFTLFSTVLTEDVDLAFELLSDILFNATFPEDELERERQRSLSALRLNKSQPSALASEFFFKTLYGDHPYGRTTTEASLNAISREDLASYASTTLKPEGALLVVAGDISLDRVRNLADGHFSDWSGAAPAAEFAAPPAAGPTEILLVHRPGSDQSNILVGNLGLRAGDDALYASTVGNKILGGGPDARLFMILREEKGWTYGAGSGFAAQRADVGYFRASTEVRNAVTDSALTELLAQLRRVRAEPVSAEELTAAKGFLVGSFPRSIETPQQIAGQVSTVRRLNLPEDYLETYRSRLDAVGAPEILEAMNELVKPDSAVIVVVGDGAEIYDMLASVADVRVIDVDGNPVDPASLNTVAVNLEPSLLRDMESEYNVMLQGQNAGTMTAGLAIEGETGRAFQNMSLQTPQFALSQNSEVLFDAATARMRSSTTTIEVGPMMAQTTITYDGEHVTGTVQLPGRPPQDVDTTVVAGTIDDGLLTALVLQLELEEGAAYSIKVFESSEGAPASVTISVTGSEEVTVPGGTFDTWRVEIVGLETGNVLNISKEDEPRMVRMSVVGQPLVLEMK